MDKNKLAALAESIMLGSGDAEEIGGGAENLVLYIKRIEDFTNGIDLTSVVADHKGETLTSTVCGEECAEHDENKTAVSMSKLSEDGFVVIPRVV